MDEEIGSIPERPYWKGKYLYPTLHNEKIEEKTTGSLAGFAYALDQKYIWAIGLDDKSEQVLIRVARK